MDPFDWIYELESKSKLSSKQKEKSERKNRFAYEK